MCDFRKIKQIQIIETKELIDIEETHPWPWEKLNEIAPKGFYYIVCTGSWHRYSNGERWLDEFNPKYLDCRDGEFVVVSWEPYELNLGEIVYDPES